MNLRIRAQLSLMMFMEFFVWGLWFVTMGTYLGEKIGALDTQVGLAYGTQSLGAIIAPFFIGLIADKYFAAQKILGVLHLLGAFVLWMLTKQDAFSTFYPLLLLYMVIYMPTLALVNTVALKQMNDVEKEFSLIRLWGTIGWIAAGLLIGYLAFEQKRSLVHTFTIASYSALLLGILSFFLPHTPPSHAGKNQKIRIKDIIGLEALGLLKDRNYLIFFICSILICIPLAFYYQETNIFLNELGVSKAAGKMSIGQMSEAVLLFLMPVFFKYFSIKKMLLMGMVAWCIRYVLFGLGDAQDSVWMLYVGILLHGICYDFFFVSGQIYTDQKAPLHIRSSAQGMITLATYGIGMLVGFSVAGWVTKYFSTDTGQHDWQKIWSVPAWFSLLIIIVFFLLFQEKKKKTNI